jgi:hypothetical protein
MTGARLSSAVIEPVAMPVSFGSRDPAAAISRSIGFLTIVK